MFERLAMVFLSTALLVYQVSGHENCKGCEGEDAIGLLQSKKRYEGPHTVPDDKPSHNSNPWASASKRKYNHHRHMHEKVIDDTDYSKDCIDAYEQMKDLSLADRCPGLPTMTFAEVQAVWNEKVKEVTEKIEAKGTSEEKREKSLRQLKRIFADSLNNGKPTIVEASVPKQLGWVAADHWHKDELANFMGDTSWQRLTFNYPDWIVTLNSHTTLKDYISHNESKDDVFLFVSESGCHGKEDQKLVDKIRDQFAPSPEFGYGPEECQAIIAVDGRASSHGFHCHDPVWNTQVEGIKQWWLLEPFYGSDYEDEIGLMEWGGAPMVNSSGGSSKRFEYPNACAMLGEVGPPPGAFKCAMKPGEMIILPDSWIHATCGLSEFTIAAGGWLAGPDREK